MIIIIGTEFNKSQRIQRIQSYQWPLGIPVCKITRVSYLSGSVVAIGTILLIATERYQGIMYPIKAGAVNNKKTKIEFGIGLVWIIASRLSPLCQSGCMVANVVDGGCKLHWAATYLPSV